MAKKLKTYSIYAIVEMDVMIKIEAENFEDALAKSKQLKETDFVKPLGEYNDGEMDIRGVYDEQIDMLHRK
jgi:putative lipoic acid-binding regulatory protein